MAMVIFKKWKHVKLTVMKDAALLCHHSTRVSLCMCICVVMKSHWMSMQVAEVPVSHVRSEIPKQARHVYQVLRAVLARKDV